MAIGLINIAVVCAQMVAFENSHTAQAKACLAVSTTITCVHSESGVITGTREGVRTVYTTTDKVKGGNWERQVIWNSQAKSRANYKLHPSFLVRIISMKGEFGSSKNGWTT